MVSWAAFQEAEPEMATEGRRLLYRDGEGSALLATVRGSSLPRIHPINVGMVGDGLFAFILDSAKGRDLEEDGRFALHAHQDPEAPNEFSLRGRVLPVEEGTIRAGVATAWYFTTDDDHRLFEFSIESVVFGARPTAASWPPVYRTWRAPSGRRL